MKKVGRVTVFLLKIGMNFADLNRGQLAKTQGEVVTHAQPAAATQAQAASGRVRISGCENADSRRGQQIYLPDFLAALSASSISLLF